MISDTRILCVVPPLGVVSAAVIIVVHDPPYQYHKDDTLNSTRMRLPHRLHVHIWKVTVCGRGIYRQSNSVLMIHIHPVLFVLLPG